MAASNPLPVLLNCVECKEFTQWEPKGPNKVGCGECGRNHSKNSLMMADPEKTYDRDEEGNLLEQPP